jgi:protein ImuB
LYLRLRTLETCALRGQSLSLLPDELRSGDSLHHMLERIAARLGPDSVRAVYLQDDHRPECMQTWQTLGAQAGAAVSTGIGRPISATAQTGMACGTRATSQAIAAQALYPTWLLPQVRSLPCGADGLPQWDGPLALLAGPQRLEAGLLDGESPALRDYFVARSQRHGLLWIYCDRLGGKDGTGDKDAAQWYLHGVFA